jgi:voltage-gated potassium channel Kch
MKEFLIFSRHSLHMLWHVRGVILVLAVALFSCAVIISRVEGVPFVDALYFTLITGLTIGYGDIVPTTTAGRVLSVLAGVIGVIFVGLIVAIATRSLALAAQEALDEQEKKK